MRCKPEPEHTQAEGIVYDYFVDTTQAFILLMKYAIVLEAPGHGPSADPYFKLEIIDELGNVIDPNCGEFEFTPENKNIIFDVCNGKEIKVKNGCKIVARSSGPDASRGVGGVTWLIFDEAAFIENGKDVYASALPTVSTGGHIIMISTPNGKDMLYY